MKNTTDFTTYVLKALSGKMVRLIGFMPEEVESLDEATTYDFMNMRTALYFTDPQEGLTMHKIILAANGYWYADCGQVDPNSTMQPSLPI